MTHHGGRTSGLRDCVQNRLAPNRFLFGCWVIYFRITRYRMLGACRTRQLRPNRRYPQKNGHDNYITLQKKGEILLTRKIMLNAALWSGKSPMPTLFIVDRGR